MGKKERQKSKVLLCVVGVLSFFALLGLFPSPAKATTGINQELSFEGKIVNASGINIADGTYNVEFKIYSGGTATGGGTLNWTEDELVHNTQAVTFTSGTFQVNLGAVTAFGTNVNWNSYPLYLSIQIGNTSNCTVTTTFQSNCGGDGEMSPYILLTATPYAMNSNQLGGLTAAQFLQLAPGSAQVDSGTTSSAFINKTGASGNILELQKAGADVATISNTGSVALQNSVDSTTALNVIGHTSGLSVFNVDTTNSRVGIGTATPAASLDIANATTANTGAYALQIKQNNSASQGAYIFVNQQSSTLDALNVQGWNSGGAGTLVKGLDVKGNGNVGIGTTSPNYPLDVVGTANASTSILTPLLDTATSVPLTIGTSSSVINLNQSTTVAANKSLTANGSVLAKDATNSSTALQIQDASGNSLFNASTSDYTIINNGTADPGNLLQNGGFESASTSTNGASGWGLSTYGSIVNNATNAHSGNQYLQIAADGSADDVSDSQYYQASPGDSIYVEGWMQSVSATGTGGFWVQFLDKNKTNIQWNSITGGYFSAASVTSWTKLSGTLVAPANTSYINIASSVRSGSTGTWRFDDMKAQKINAYNPVIVSPTINTATAFQVQNAAGAPVFLVDTTSTMANGNQLNYLTYPGFESGSFTNAAAGWVAVSPATLTQNQTKVHTYNGSSSAQVVTTASNGGLSTTSFVSAPPTGTYIISFYAKVSSGTMASTAFTVQTTDGATHTCSPASGTTINANGFQRVYCSITATGAITALQITQNDATARTIYIDSVQLQSTSYNSATITAPTVYNVGDLQLRGTITNPVSIAPNSDSTSAFQVQNTSGATVLTVDSLNNRIGVGTSTPNQEFFQSGGKMVVSSTDRAYSQIQVANPTSNGEASITFLSGATAYGDAPTSANTPDHVWVVGAGPGGIAGNLFGIYNDNGGQLFTLTAGGNVGLTAGNTNPGATLDIGSAGTVQGAGLSADCSTQSSKLLWSSSTKQFSCGTDRSSVSIIKTADQSLPSSTTPVNDLSLSFNIGANDTYIFSIEANATFANAGGFKYEVTAPTGATCNVSSIGADATAASGELSNSACAVTSHYGGSGTASIEYIEGSIRNGSTAGTVHFMWAQNASSTTATVVKAGSSLLAYKTSGADYAETYYTKDNSVVPGTVVAIDPAITAGVKHTTTPYQSNALGIISTMPGQIVGDDTASTGRPVPLALSGRVPVKVSSINGNIQPGDYLTSSSIPGVAMKATHPGPMIGRALQAYTSNNPQAVGIAMTFVNLTWGDPNDASSIQGSTDAAASTLSSSQTDVQGQLTTLSSTVAQLSNALAHPGPLSLTGTSGSEFQIQNSQGTDLLVADTSHMNITIANATITGTLTLNGHVITSGPTPTVTVLPAAGVDTSGKNDATCSVTGTDTNGTITLVTGTDHTINGPECTITFAKPFSSAPRPVFSPTTQESVDTGMYVSTTPEAMTLNFTHAPESHHSYSFNYWNPQ